MPDIPHNKARHYYERSEVPRNLQKYYYQRHDIWELYDEGIWMTDDSWFSVTPEPVAKVIASHITGAAPNDKTVLIDLFCGSGGNTIQFALSSRWEHIYAVDNNPEVLECAKHNAEIYGVSDRITWMEGDAFELLEKDLSKHGNEAVIFASPPWGGPTYTEDLIYDLSKMLPYSFEQLYSACAEVTGEFVLYLPRSSDMTQLAKFASTEERLPVLHYTIGGNSKGIGVYFGNFMKA